MTITMTQAAYLILACTAIYALVRLTLDLNNGRAMRKKLRERYGEECCLLLRGAEGRKKSESKRLGQGGG